MSTFAALERADWHGVIALSSEDRDPQDSPTVPIREEETGWDWRDHSWQARRDITRAERAERHGDKRLNLLAARERIDIALRLLCETGGNL